MLRYALSVAFSITAVVTATPPASADAPCSHPPCRVRPVVVHKTYQLPRIYIVDLGPVYVIPGIYTYPTVVKPRPLPRYRYVGRTYPAYVEPLRVRAEGQD